jgi:hypothetical protein
MQVNHEVTDEVVARAGFDAKVLADMFATLANRSPNGTLTGRGSIRLWNDRRSSVRKSPPTWTFVMRAGDGNRTRTISLGS